MPETAMTILAFDVDGTITEARRRIDSTMLDMLLALCDSRRVWIVTGSNESKCSEQIGTLFYTAERVYCCAGSELWTGGNKIKSTDWHPPVQLGLDLLAALEASGYDEQTGHHLEVRTGMINLSIPGRNATQAQRDRFTAWDDKTKTRRRIADDINLRHPQVHATLGGKTGIDITKRGCGKHVILSDADESIWFWGDECRSGGNDYSLAESLTRPGDRVFCTTGWQDTYHQLKEITGI
jgi:phosphomannomutase